MNDLARLWVLAHSVVVIDLMLGNLIARSGCSPVPINGHPDVLHFHHRPPINAHSPVAPTLGACLTPESSGVQHARPLGRTIRVRLAKLAYKCSRLSCKDLE